jgi:uncharacterized peroxidase-related enzyme
MDAAWIATIDENDADGELKAAYDRVGATRGKVSNIFKAQSLDPGSLQAHLDLYLSLMFGKGKLSRREREMIAVVVSGENDCAYCVAHHSEALNKYVKDQTLIVGLASDPHGAELAPREKAMVDYAVALTKDPDSLTEGDIQKLRAAGLAEDEILQLNLIASYFNFVNRVASGLGVKLEEERTSYRY